MKSIIWATLGALLVAAVVGWHMSAEVENNRSYTAYRERWIASCQQDGKPFYVCDDLFLKRGRS